MIRSAGRGGGNCSRRAGPIESRSMSMESFPCHTMGRRAATPVNGLSGRAFRLPGQAVACGMSALEFAQVGGELLQAVDVAGTADALVVVEDEEVVLLHGREF